MTRNDSKFDAFQCFSTLKRISWSFRKDRHEGAIVWSQGNFGTCFCRFAIKVRDKRVPRLLVQNMAYVRERRRNRSSSWRKHPHSSVIAQWQWRTQHQVNRAMFALVNQKMWGRGNTITSKHGHLGKEKKNEKWKWSKRRTLTPKGPLGRGRDCLNASFVCSTIRPLAERVAERKPGDHVEPPRYAIDPFKLYLKLNDK